MSDQRLHRRNGVYYYRRRVPVHLVEKLGKKVVQISLHTTSFNEAKKLRTLKDLEWDTRFDEFGQPKSGVAPPASALPTASLSEPGIAQLIRDYVARQDARSREPSNNPRNTAEMVEMRREGVRTPGPPRP